MNAAHETLPFQAETRQLLDIVIHSLYSNKEIFLRELISNASDALDKLKLEALQDHALLDTDPLLEIELVPDSKARTLTVSDSGIGMTRDELIALIGTIAKSGTRELVEQLKAASPGDAAATLIGQFGVGFYSSFMVADRVEIVTRKAGAESATRWESTGDGTYTVSEASRFRRGTDIILHLKAVDPENGLADYTSAQVLRSLVKKHSDFVAHPIKLKEVKDGVPQWTTLNSMKPIWTQAAAEVGEENYAEFYRHLSHDWQDPLDRISLKAEGRLEYQALLFVPSKAPFDLYYRDQEYGLQLHVRRVLIMDRCRQLLPPFLRFVKGVVDSADLPLNLSREMIQHDRHISQMRTWLTRKVLDHLAAMLADRREIYLKFWGEFGTVLKEGVATADTEHRDRLLKLLLFNSTREGAEPTSLAEYVARMEEGQASIYYLTAESRAVAERSPHIEAFRARGHEVLFFVDPIDEFVAQSVHEFEGKPIVSVARAGVEPGSEADRKTAEDARKARDTELRPFLAFLEQTLADTIREARVSSRLTTSPACLVAGEHDLTPGLERMRGRGEAEPGSERQTRSGDEASGAARGIAERPVAGRCGLPAGWNGAAGGGHRSVRSGNVRGEGDGAHDSRAIAPLCDADGRSRSGAPCTPLSRSP
jgi:molecular chaperone HtpG